MTLRPVPACAAPFVKQVEGCNLTPFRDDGGTWTDGYGNTNGVAPGVAITQDQADSDLDANLLTAAHRLAAVVKDPVIWALTEHEYGALLSFVFNLGAKSTWTIWTVLNAGAPYGSLVTDQMKRFDKIKLADGTVETVPGLDARRLAEVALWNTGDVDASAAIVAAAPVQPPPSSYTRAAATPPTPPVIAPLSQSKTLAASVATAVAGAAGAAQPMLQNVSDGLKQANDTITPYAVHMKWIGSMQSSFVDVLAVLAVATSVLIIVSHFQRKAA